MDEQVALVDRTAVLGKSGTGDDATNAQRIGERFGNRADIAFWGRVESGTVLEDDLPGALRKQPFQGPQ